MNLLLIFFALFGAPTPVIADSIAGLNVQYSTTTAEDIVRAYAIHYGISGDQLFNTIKCESRTLDPDALGDHGLARGLAQIRTDYHPEVTSEEAYNPFFAIDFMARYFAAGRAHEWTCWRNLYGKSASQRGA